MSSEDLLCNLNSTNTGVGKHLCEGPGEAVARPSLELLKQGWKSPEQPSLDGPTSVRVGLSDI